MFGIKKVNISTCALLVVFLIMNIFVDTHNHADVFQGNGCELCSNNVEHPNHFAQRQITNTHCCLCQFISFSFNVTERLEIEPYYNYTSDANDSVVEMLVSNNHHFFSNKAPPTA